MQERRDGPAGGWRRIWFLGVRNVENAQRWRCLLGGDGSSGAGALMAATKTPFCLRHMKMETARTQITAVRDAKI